MTRIKEDVRTVNMNMWNSVSYFPGFVRGDVVSVERPEVNVVRLQFERWRV